jgi:phosphoglycerate dehydrogenase-like enzyme
MTQEIDSKGNESKKRVILTDYDLPEKARKVLLLGLGRKFEICNFADFHKELSDLVEIVLLASPRSGLLSRENLSLFKNLRMIQTLSAGVDYLNFEAIPRRVVVCGNVGAYAEQIAEHVFAMILCFSKNLILQHQNLSKGIFSRKPDSRFLKGKTIAILGAGGIGKAVAKIAKAFGMRTIGINRSGKLARHFDSMFRMRNLNQVLGVSDFVVISLPLTKMTRNLIDRKRLALMKKDCILVNVARGPIIVEEDLYKHLKANPDFKCALDVWWKYPEDRWNKKAKVKFSQHYPFFDLPNFLGTPHSSGDVPEGEEIAALQAARNIVNFVKGRPVKGCADRSEYL